MRLCPNRERVEEKGQRVVSDGFTAVSRVCYFLYLAFAADDSHFQIIFILVYETNGHP